MLHVINGGDKPTQKFHDFVDLCCKGFNLVRKNGNLLLNLFALMASSGIPGVTLDAVSYVQRALLPDLSSTEAAATFARFIEESLSSWFTQVTFCSIVVISLPLSLFYKQWGSKYRTSEYQKLLNTLHFGLLLPIVGSSNSLGHINTKLHKNLKWQPFCILPFKYPNF